MISDSVPLKRVLGNDERTQGSREGPGRRAGLSAPSIGARPGRYRIQERTPMRTRPLITVTALLAAGALAGVAVAHAATSKPVPADDATPTPVSPAYTIGLASDATGRTWTGHES